MRKTFEKLYCVPVRYITIYWKVRKTQNKRCGYCKIGTTASFPEKQLNAVLKKYKGAKQVWVQEEPSNMGYWSYMLRYMPGLEVIARKASASPATGYNKVHKVEQEKIVAQALES